MRRIVAIYYQVVFRDGVTEEAVSYPYANAVPYSEADAQRWATALVSQLRTAGIEAQIRESAGGAR